MWWFLESLCSNSLLVKTELKLIESLTEGSSISGVIKNITDYGAFVDLGGIDGLLHITDLAWRRIKHPSEVLNIGDEITAMILKYDQEKNRVSLGLKQLETDPWSTLNDKYPISTKVEGVVTNLTDYGAFVEIEPGIEGLVHVSEMDWTNKSIHPRKVVQLGDSVKVAVLEIDSNKKKNQPWNETVSSKSMGKVFRKFQKIRCH